MRLGIQHDGTVRHGDGFITHVVMTDQRHLHLIRALFQGG
jgi:hypothetical protein